MTWSRHFDAPIEAGNTTLTSLRDAATYITTLPDAEQRKDHWQLAIEMFLKVAEHGFPITFAEMALGRALAHGKPAPQKSTRRKPAKKYRVVR